MQIFQGEFSLFSSKISCINVKYSVLSVLCEIQFCVKSSLLGSFIPYGTGTSINLNKAEKWNEHKNDWQLTQSNLEVIKYCIQVLAPIMNDCLPIQHSHTVL